MNHKVKVLLVGNYAPDQQESMQRFSNVLLHHLPATGVAAELLRPQPVWARGLARPHGLGKWLGYMDKLVWFPLTLKQRIVNATAERLVVHICDHSNAIYTKYLTRTKHLVTCHDMLAIRSGAGLIPENRTSRTGRIYQQLILSGLKKSGYVACVSKATQTDLVETTGLSLKRTRVIYNGLNFEYFPVLEVDAVPLIRKVCPMLVAGERGSSVLRPYIVHVGGNQWYKNRLGLLRAYHKLVKIMPRCPLLVMVGKPLDSAMREFLQANGLEHLVLEVTRCGNETLRALFSMASTMLFPSLMEGFGWPIIEAQACGCPVVTTDRPPMTEVGGSAAVYINPRNYSDFAQKIKDLLLESVQERDRRAKESLLNASLFSTDAMVAGYAALYEELLTCVE